MTSDVGYPSYSVLKHAVINFWPVKQVFNTTSTYHQFFWAAVAEQDYHSFSHASAHVEIKSVNRFHLFALILVSTNFWVKYLLWDI